MTFLDLFAGVGGFRRGMELAGHKCVGFCEWDKFATASYTSMHLLTEDQRSYLADMTLKARQKEILKEKYRNGEYYSTDVRLLRGDTIPKADCWCFGAPCQDFSIVGQRKGLDGDRSSLVREVFRILSELEEPNRPEWLIYENVKGMLSSNRGFDFAAILLEMGELGYDIEWELFNTKDFGIPQNRERVYVIGHLRCRGRKQIFPLQTADGENSICEVVPNVIGGFGEINYGKQWRQGNRVYDGTKIATAVLSNPVGNCGGDTCLYAIPIQPFDETGNHKNNTIDTNKSFGGKYTVHTPEGICRTMTGQGHYGTEPKVAIPVNSDDISGINVVWYDKYKCYLTIRRLTPKECFRLQGWTDDYFEKAAFVNSDSQLYKQAGNGVTVAVVEAIGKAIQLV